MEERTWQQANFVISTDKTKLDLFTIHEFLKQTYWATDRTLNEVIQTIQYSFCFGMYDQHKTIGFARLITDKITFAYLADVFLLESYRGRGLAKWLLQTIIEHDEFKHIPKWMLRTTDAHDLYKKFGFEMDNDTHTMIRSVKREDK